MNRIDWLLAIVVIGFAGLTWAEVKPIKNPEPVTKTIARERVVFMYSMKQRFWDDGSKITVMYQDPASKAHQEFCTNVLEVSPTRFAQMVNTYINNGNAAYYRKVSDAPEMARRVAEVSGSIGYIDANYLVVNKGDQHVQILRIVD